MFKLFVVRFPKEMDESALATFFGDFRDVLSVKIITEINRSKQRARFYKFHE